MRGDGGGVLTLLILNSENSVSVQFNSMSSEDDSLLSSRE